MINTREDIIYQATMSVQEKQYVRAEKLLSNNHISHKEFLQETGINSHYHSDALLNFVLKQPEPHYNLLLSHLDIFHGMKVLDLLKKKNISFAKEDDEGNSIISSFLPKLNGYSYSVYWDLIENIPADVWAKEIKKPNGAENMFSYLFSDDNIPYERVKEFFSKLVEHNIHKEPEYQEVFKHNTALLHTVLSWKFDHLHYNLKCMGVEETIVNSIISTKTISRLFVSKETDLDDKYIFNTKELIRKNQFSPQLEFLKPQYMQPINEGKINLMHENAFKLFNILLKNNFLPKDSFKWVKKLKLNNEEKTYTFFEAFLSASFKNNKADISVKDFFEDIFNKITVLEQSGIEIAISTYTKEKLQKKFEDSMHSQHYHNHKSTVFGKYTKDIEELSEDIHIPSHVLDKVVNFFDNKFNFTINKNPDIIKEEKQEQESIQSIKGQWIIILDSLPIIKIEENIIQNNKYKIK